jgi:hypothetical protein
MVAHSNINTKESKSSTTYVTLHYVTLLLNVNSITELKDQKEKLINLQLEMKFCLWKLPIRCLCAQQGTKFISGTAVGWNRHIKFCAHAGIKITVASVKRTALFDSVITYYVTTAYLQSTSFLGVSRVRIITVNLLFLLCYLYGSRWIDTN